MDVVDVTFGQRRSASLPDAAQDPAMLKAAYRFFDTDAIEPDAILASHISATHDRCSSVPIILAVQDTSELDWSHHPSTTGLGPIHTKTHVGLLMHTTLAITPGAVPIGILHQHVWARDADTFGSLPDHHDRAFADKESYRWVRGLAAINTSRDACPTTQFVMVADAETDIYDVLVAERRAGVDLLFGPARIGGWSTPRPGDCGTPCRMARVWERRRCGFLPVTGDPVAQQRSRSGSWRSRSSRRNTVRRKTWIRSRSGRSGRWRSGHQRTQKRSNGCC